MCVDGSCGTFTKPGEKPEGLNKLQAVLEETAGEIAAQLPGNIPAPLRHLLGALVTAEIASEAFAELKAEHAARDNREMTSADLGMVA